MADLRFDLTDAETLARFRDIAQGAADMRGCVDPELESYLGRRAGELGVHPQDVVGILDELRRASPAPVPPVAQPVPSLGPDLEFVRISAGTFLMGAPPSDPEAHSGERPQHKVALTRPFEILTTPVTQRLYKSVMQTNPSFFPGPDRPVENVSWHDAVSFCNALSRASGLPEAYSGDSDSVRCDFANGGYRLPTEAEWEYACRAGTTGPRYGGLDEIAWHMRNSGAQTNPVRQKKPNAWGLYDMIGNVGEWCWDWYGLYEGDGTDPVGPDTGSDRVHRGGSWCLVSSLPRASLRGRVDPGYRSNGLGFRLSRSVP